VPEIKVKNWDRFQHYATRRPPWIRLYHDLLDDPEWHKLDGETAKILVMLWLIASESKNGTLPAMPVLAFRLRVSEDVLNIAISKLNHWLNQRDASTVLANGKQHASGMYSEMCSETETEAETEAETDPSLTLPKLSVEEIRIRWNTIPNVKLCDDIQEALLDRINRLRKLHQQPWWDKLFDKVAHSPFLTGQVPGRDGKRPFRASLGWVTGKVILGKVLAGDYSDTTSAPKTRPTKVAL
jgi:hypothetical protein